MAITLLLPGKPIAAPPVEAGLEDVLKIEVLRAQEVPSLTRDASPSYEKFPDARDEDLVEFEYQNGVKQWISVGQLRTDLKEQSRSSTTGPEEVAVPAYGLYGVGSRDWKSTSLRLLKVMRLSPVDTAIEIAADVSADVAARRIAAYFESKLSPGPGLYRLTDVFTCSQLDKAIDASKPNLLFIHGTASSSEGSFASMALATGQSSLSIIRNSTPEWKQLSEFYGGRVLTFEHSTLSQSPIDNALELANALPPKMPLHLVTHSRGGLVGELLCMRNLDDSFLEPLAKKRPGDAEKLRKLADLLKARDFNIERFVRVACPARGTILASTRLDWYFSILLNLVGSIPILALNPAFKYLKATLLELIKRRAQPEFLPGLEAQMPSSPLINLINRTDLQTKADLAVIAGGLEGADFLGRLKVLATDLFYWKDHDLVVNTDAMYGGLHRAKAYFYFDKGPQVNHFQYFLNHKTRGLVVNWLTQGTGKPADTAFQELQRGATPSLEKAESRGDDKRPVVLLIGDFMTTHLHDEKGRIWLDFNVLMSGGLERLRADAQGIDPKTIIRDPYQQLATYLGVRFQVEHFPYDWRLSPTSEGARLAKKLEELLKTERPVHILAHGLGGLLVETALPPGGSLETRFKQMRGRVLTVGTPFAGWDFSEGVASGTERIVRLLALMDLSKNEQEIGELMRHWPSLLETKPGNRQRVRPAIPNLIYITGSTAENPEGDGRVTHAQAGGRIDYYINAAHGDVLRYSPAFAALSEILEDGRTSRLSTSPTQSRTPSRQPGADPILFPEEQDLLAAALGALPPTRVVESKIKVSVLHADVSEAVYPVMVGHYQGSKVVSGEARLDQQLDGALSRRHQMNMYPGPLGTVDIIRLPDRRPKGAIIVGLGETQAVRQDNVRAAVLKAALSYANRIAEEPDGGAESQWRSAGFSCVLIGTKGSQPLSARSSITSIVRAAIEANRALRVNGLWDRVRIDEVQFVEVYGDVATEAARFVADGLSKALLSIMAVGESIVPSLLITGYTGLGQSPATSYDDGWWRRIQVECKETGGRQRFLKYVVAADRARAEETGSVTQVKMLDHFIAKAIGSPEYDKTLAKALYSALLPNRIKDQLLEGDDLLLVLDEVSAQYPWELLTPASSDEKDPLVTTLGMIRQFKTSEFEQKPRTIAARKALVIGEPLLDEVTRRTFKDLAGAREEAEAVSRLLVDAGYQVTEVIQRNAHDAFLRLYSEEFKILHLAGHGVYDQDGITGMVLGEDLFLTAEDLNNLPFVPELAFLNCCHLARMPDGGLDPVGNRERLQSANRLAASLSEALIRRGAKAVVAAGWAVSDGAALTFSETLYGHLLANESFGRAVLEARKEVFREHGRTNTWGAYQCYGDPYFRLNIDVPDQSAAEPQTRDDIVTAVKNLAADVRLGKNPEAVKKKGIELYGRIQKQWDDGELLGLIGDVLRDLGEFETAIDAYDKAVQDPNSAAPIRIIEQLGNLQNRYANCLIDRASRAPEPTRAELLAKASQYTVGALKNLEWVFSLGPTPERLALLGGLHKRMAGTDASKRLESLEKSADYYEQAYNVTGQDPYPLLNWLTLRAVLSKQKGEDKRSELRPLIEEARKVVQNRINSNGDFWARVGEPDSGLLAFLVAGNLPEHMEEIKAAYRKVVVTAGATERMKQSVRSQIAWIRDFWPAEAQDEIAALTQIEQSIV
jgi:tetratricopeptide (TPR) repeat protein